MEDFNIVLNVYIFFECLLHFNLTANNLVFIIVGKQ